MGYHAITEIEDAPEHDEPESVRVKMATLEERMNTVTAQNEALKSDVNASLALLREDMAKRDRDNIRWQLGLWVSFTIVIIAAVGLLIRTGGTVPGA